MTTIHRWAEPEGISGEHPELPDVLCVVTWSGCAASIAAQSIGSPASMACCDVRAGPGRVSDPTIASSRAASLARARHIATRAALTDGLPKAMAISS